MTAVDCPRRGSAGTCSYQIFVVWAASFGVDEYGVEIAHISTLSSTSSSHFSPKVRLWPLLCLTIDLTCASQGSWNVVRGVRSSGWGSNSYRSRRCSISTQIHTHSTLSNPTFGGARYIATGCGFATTGISFSILFS
jgi:hypothetical protein